MGTSPKELLESIDTLLQAGFDIPPELRTYVQEEEWKRRGIVQVWTCKCGMVYESEVKLKEFTHLCSGLKQPGPRSLSLIWKSRQG